jgi:hypothetical protein
METVKVQLYTDIHKGLRNMISRFIFKVGATDWSDAAAVTQLRSQWQELLSFLHAHHGHEDEKILPLLARISPGLQRSYASDHKAQGVVLDDLDGHLQRLAENQVPAAQRAELGEEFHRSFNLFYGDYLRHLYREETEAQRALELLCPAEEIAATQSVIIGGMPQQELRLTIAVMFPALSLTEVFHMMAPMKATAPPQMFNMLAELVHQARGDADWARLKTMLGM